MVDGSLNEDRALGSDPRESREGGPPNMIRLLLICAAWMGVSLGALCTIALAAYWLLVTNRYDPTVEGKRLHEWADQAVDGADPATRHEAVEVLRRARGHLGEEARLGLYKRLYADPHERAPRDHLPEELPPFLLEAFQAEDECAGLVAGCLERCPATQTIPPLVAMLRGEKVRFKRVLLIQTLGRFGPQAAEAAPLIHAAFDDPDREIRAAARTALEHIEPGGHKARQP
jgi:hypothetical protein